MNIIFIKKDKICTHESLHRIIKTHTRQALYKYDINEIWDLGDISISVPVYSLLV